MTSINEAKTISDIEGLVEVFDEKKVMVLKNVFLFNHHLLHPRMLDIFTELLKIEKDNDLNAIVISETGPKDRYGEYLKDSKIMVISLPYHLGETFKAIEEKNKNFGIGAAIWINLIYTFCHELHHNVAYAVDWAMAEEDLKAEEDTAHDYGLHMMEEVQRTMDAEVPALGQLPWFGPRIMQHMIEKIQAGEQLWTKQKEMADAGIVFEKGADQYTSIRKYFEDSSKKETWENEGAELELKYNTTKQEEAVVQTPVTEQTAMVFGKGNIPGMQRVEAEAEYALDPEDLEALDMHEQLSGRVAPDKYEADTDGSVTFEDIARGMRNVEKAGGHEAIIERGKEAAGKLGITQPKNIMEAAKTVWMELYNHIFTNCGFAGRTFNAIKAIYWPVPISQDTITKNLFQKSHSMSDAGASWIVCHNGIKGRTFKDGKLPGYLVQLNINGQARKFMLIAQNSETTSSYAQRARDGEKIAWLIDSDTNEYKALIANGVYHTSINRQWVPAQ